MALGSCFTTRHGAVPPQPPPPSRCRAAPSLPASDAGLETCCEQVPDTPRSRLGWSNRPRGSWHRIAAEPPPRPASRGARGPAFVSNLLELSGGVSCLLLWQRVAAQKLAAFPRGLAQPRPALPSLVLPGQEQASARGADWGRRDPQEGHGAEHGGRARPELTLGVCKALLFPGNVPIRASCLSVLDPPFFWS